MRYASTSDMRAIDAKLLETTCHFPGVPDSDRLIKLASQGLANLVLEMQGGAPARPCVHVVFGNGNNGADAVYAGLELAARGFPVRCYAALEAAQARGALNALLEAGRLADVVWFEPERPWTAMPPSAIARGDVVLDGILGIGAKGAPREPAASAIRFVNRLKGRARIVAVDIPSGLDADTGAAAGEVVEADLTLCMGMPKTGLSTPFALGHAGSIQVNDLEIPDDLLRTAADADELVTARDVAGCRPRRRWDAHKGDFGHVCVVGGCDRYRGAPALAALGALRAGAGLVTAVVPKAIANAVASHAPEMMILPLDSEVVTRSALEASGFPFVGKTVVVGPGLSQQAGVLDALVWLLEGGDAQAAVIDADALNTVGDEADALAVCDMPMILTPHPGEAARNHFVPGVKHFIDGGNNLWADPGFVAPWANDFRLYEGAPAAGYGVNGEDLGPSPSGPRVALPPIQTYYVRLDGSDANTGLDNTPAGAFLTLQKAADAVTPGDTVRVQAGTYAAGATIATGGSGDQWVRFVADGAVAVTNASGPALSMQGANRVAFKGFAFTAANGNGVELNEAQGCRFENCALTGSKLAGAFLNRSHEAEFVNTSISGNKVNGALLYLSGETFFDRCRVFGNTGAGIYSGRYGGGSVGGAVWGVVRNSLVYQNTGYGFATARDSASHNWTFENSVFDGNGGGIHVNYFGGDATLIRNTAVTFNTGSGIYRETQYGLSVVNCDVFGNGTAFSGNAITPVNSISVDPLYRGRATGNFHILAASPCVDAGANQLWMAKGEATAFDLDGNPRIAGGIVDIGAYEVFTAPSMMIVR